MTVFCKCYLLIKYKLESGWVCQTHPKGPNQQMAPLLILVAQHCVMSRVRACVTISFGSKSPPTGLWSYINIPVLQSAVVIKWAAASVAAIPGCHFCVLCCIIMSFYVYLLSPSCLPVYYSPLLAMSIKYFFFLSFEPLLPKCLYFLPRPVHLVCRHNWVFLVFVMPATDTFFSTLAFGIVLT